MSATNCESQSSPPVKLGLNRIEAAKSLGVSPATLDRLAQRGLIRPCRATYRPIYWVKELERFLKENSKETGWSA
jgi:DNA-binding transcriptional MerR regulator